MKQVQEIISIVFSAIAVRLMVVAYAGCERSRA
jgi:hypothetical protein